MPLKSGAEYIVLNEQTTLFQLIDFWKWSESDLLSDATRGRLAEFIEPHLRSSISLTYDKNGMNTIYSRQQG